MHWHEGRDEANTCRDLILPMLTRAGWTPELVREQFPLRADRVLSAGITTRRLGNGRADYVLEAAPGLPVAVLEAKREFKNPADGLQQAIRYAIQLDVPIAYSSNGHQVVERNLRTGTERIVESPGTPPELWAEWITAQGLNEQTGELLRQPFNRNRTTITGDILTPRWYQAVAVHRVLRALANNQRRVLLLMATGTGKTFTAMQIVEKLRSYHRLRHPNRNFRTLYLADRDWLLSQPMAKDFSPAFGGDPLHRVRGGANLSRELYFATYQALSGADDTEVLLHHYPPDFFDLVIVDECHRGSAAEDSTWRRVLEHFDSAAQLGLTATPKRDATGDSYVYFGNPVFTYSLRDGIEDGYLAPYRVRRVVLSPDADGWTPDPGEVDRLGREIPEGTYSTRDFERVLSLLVRTRVAAHHLSGVLRAADNARTIVFCVDSQHAEDMRAAMAAENPDLMTVDPEWVVRIVGDEPERERLLEAFTDAESSSPSVATTSRLLSTGIDVEDLAFVVLFRPVGSMVEFKQIIGRGTRLYPEKGKRSFDVIDYVGATSKFEDPDFDGYPAEIIDEVTNADGDPVRSSDDERAVGEPTPHAPHDDHIAPRPEIGSVAAERPYRQKLYVDEGEFRVAVEASYVPDTSTGRLRLTEYGEYVRDQVRSIAGSPGDLSLKWSARTGRSAIESELHRRGVTIAELTQPEAAAGRDALDILIEVAWNQPALTRAERARRVRIKHGEEIARRSALAQSVLGSLLDRYSDYGVDDITSGAVLQVSPFDTLGSPISLAREFGGVKGWHAQIDELQRWLYSA